MELTTMTRASRYVPGSPQWLSRPSVLSDHTNDDMPQNDSTSLYISLPPLIATTTQHPPLQTTSTSLPRPYNLQTHHPPSLPLPWPLLKSTTRRLLATIGLTISLLMTWWTYASLEEAKLANKLAAEANWEARLANFLAFRDDCRAQMDGKGDDVDEGCQDALAESVYYYSPNGRISRAAASAYAKRTGRRRDVEVPHDEGVRPPDEHDELLERLIERQRENQMMYGSDPGLCIEVGEHWEEVMDVLERKISWSAAIHPRNDPEVLMLLGRCAPSTVRRHKHVDSESKSDTSKTWHMFAGSTPTQNAKIKEREAMILLHNTPIAREGINKQGDAAIMYGGIATYEHITETLCVDPLGGTLYPLDIYEADTLIDRCQIPVVERDRHATVHDIQHLKGETDTHESWQMFMEPLSISMADDSALPMGVGGSRASCLGSSSLVSVFVYALACWVLLRSIRTSGKMKSASLTKMPERRATKSKVQ